MAYAILCLENYVLQKYSAVDFDPVVSKAWCIVSEESIDERAYDFMEIIPEYLYEFDSYADVGFECLSEDEYDTFIGIIPRDDETLDIVMHRIYDIAMDCAYVGFDAPAKETIDHLFDVIDAMKQSDVALPDIGKVEAFAFELVTRPLVLLSQRGSFSGCLDQRATPVLESHPRLDKLEFVSNKQVFHPHVSLIHPPGVHKRPL